MDNSKLIESGFRPKPFRAKYLKSYYAQMSRDSDKVVYDDEVADQLLEQGFSIEVAPRSLYSVEKLFDGLLKYAPSLHPLVAHSSTVSEGIVLAYRLFAKPKDAPALSALPLDLRSVAELTSNPSGSPGLTNYGYKKRDSMVKGLESAKKILRGEKLPEPCLAFKRTQFNGKTRLVWGYPYSMTILEGLVARPLITEYQKGFTPMAFAMPVGVLGSKLRVSSYHNKYAYSFDMSSYDSSLAATLIRSAFYIIKSWYDLDAEIGEGEWRCTLRQLFNWVERYFINTPIVMPDGKVYWGKGHGVPSGSYFTQIVDSIVNVMLCGAVNSKFNMGVSARSILVLGDDMLFWSDKNVSLNEIALYLNRTFGVKMNPEKSKVYKQSETIHYLGRDWTNGVPSLDVDEIIKRMVYPETYRIRSSDPDERRREVRMLIASYAAVYKGAWEIAEKLLVRTELSNQRGVEQFDIAAYSGGDSSHGVQPDHLSGYERFRRKYFMKGMRSIPNTALGFWT